MVKKILFFQLLLLFPMLLFSQEVVVSIDQGVEDEPIVGKIRIYHRQNQVIDKSSFQVGDQSFSPAFVGTEKPEERYFSQDSESLIVSIFTFSLPPEKKGLYLFPSVSVQVGGKKITSNSVSYEVLVPKLTDELGLRAQIAGSKEVYPGQHTIFSYQISFQKPIQLVREELPLLRFNGFRNIGAPKITTQAQGQQTVQTISQEVVAEKIGTFESGKSVIEGYIYYVDAIGQRRFQKPLLRAEAPSITVNVLPFPEEGKPGSFNGAVGVFYWQASIKGSSSVEVGEKISLEIFVSGQGDLNTVTLPAIAEQKNFKDRFLFSSLFPTGVIEQGTKRFTVEIRPLSSRTTAIPPINFSSFDPISKRYVTQNTAPIAITVRPGGKELEKIELEQNADDYASRRAQRAIEIYKNPELSASELTTSFLDMQLIFYAFFSLLIALVIQVVIKHVIEEGRDKADKSETLFLEAIRKRSDPDSACRLLRKAILLALYEKRLTEKKHESFRTLSKDGLEGECRALLFAIEEKRFTGLDAQLEMNEIIDEASSLYYRIRK